MRKVEPFCGSKVQPWRISKKPWIAKNGAAEHNAIRAGLLRFLFRVRNIRNIAVTEDESLRVEAVAKRDRLSHMLPPRRHLRHFFSSSGVNRNGGWFLG